MFQRRKKHTLWEKFHHTIWPKSGFKRALKYIGHRVARLPGTPHSIALGFAFGASISFTPFLGLHFILAGALTWLLRGNILACALGTVIGNPWTLPFILISMYHLGNFILGNTQILDAPEMISLNELLTYPYKLLLPMSIGGGLIALLSWPIFYYGVKYLITLYRKKRKLKIAKRHKEIHE